MDAPDPLLCLRAALSTFPDEPFNLVELRSDDGKVVEDVAAATQVVVKQINVSSLAHDENAPELVFAADAPVRMLRSREKVAEAGNLMPESAPDQFMSLGAYLRNAATVKVVAIPALDRPGVLEYLLGKRSEWEGVVVPGVQAKTEAAPGASDEKADKSTPSTAPSTKRPYVPDAADAEFVRTLRAKHEVVLLDRNDALAGMHALANEADVGALSGHPNKPSDTYGLRALLKPRLESAKRQLQAPSKSSASTRTPAPAANASRRSRAQDPIILLSNSPTALVNMFNVKSLLQDGVFISPEEARQQARGVPEMVVTIQTRSDDEGSGTTRGPQLSRRILVVDSAEAINRLSTGPIGSSQDAWNRVIAVFTTGQTWQFKAYRWNDPRDLFKNAMGVYVRWNNDAPNPQVRDWNVTELQVDRTKRHTDKQLVAFFWRTLDNWVQRKKPHLQLS
ncbi:accessory factor associated with RNA polymerase II [Malassezia brasiliensis]|uniref:Accessory factor associated with RNA polymerase II n=1 Tax=Malassezia brasiliensis TaxID=1821822 RepID=A0AAF0INT3_9BASI|nr:accessory factor associated with RNA polymerase II [Malassezia brasiliensis]